MFNSGNCTSIPLVASINGDGGNGGNGNNGAWADGGWLWIIVVFALLFGWGNGGWGNNGGNGSGNATQFIPYAVGSSYTDSSVQRGFDQQAVISKLDGINNGICSLGYDQLNQMNGINQNVSQQGFNLSSAIANLGYQNQQCCCDIERNIDSVRYENAKNTCDIINAGNANTQRIIDHLTANEMQTLRDQLQTANFQLSQQAQSANLINQLRPCPIPAYLSCSPYTSYDPFRSGFGSCGCNSGCGCA